MSMAARSQFFTCFYLSLTPALSCSSMFRARLCGRSHERPLENALQIRNKRQERNRTSGTVVQRRSGSTGGFAESMRRHGGLQDEQVNLRRDHDDLRRAFYEAAHAQRRLCGPRQLRRGAFEIADEI